MRYAWTLVLLLVLPVGLSAQRGRGAGAGAGGQGTIQNRTALERQIMRRFVEQNSREIGLSGGDVSRFEQILRQGNDRRRTFAERGTEYRRRLNQAIMSPGTSDAEFREILDGIDRLREEEFAQWRADQAAIGGMLSTPRQQAVFTARWLRLQEVIRDVLSQRPGPGGGMLRDTLPPPPGS